MRTTRQPRTRRRQMVNRLNDLTPREWIKFQKSWFVHNPPPREPGVLTHPAKFPETLAREFVEFFTKRGEWVLDPMVGTGSTLLAARAASRPSIGVELSEPFARLARERLADLAADGPARGHGAAGRGRRAPPGRAEPAADRLLPDQPAVLGHAAPAGFETQDGRRARGLSVTYSDSPHDLGNIDDYETFLDALCAIYTAVHAKLRPRAYLTVIVKNVKKGGKIYPLAWDLARRLSAIYALKDERIWLQDNVRLAPYGLFNAWVSNTHHHYCLTFRKE